MPPTLAAVSSAASVNPGTAWRLLATLEDHGLVARSGSGYVVGYSVVRIAASADETALKTAARPLLERLVDETQEAVSLSVPRHLTIVSIDHIAAPRVVSAGWIGEQLPLHCTSNGKLLLASLPEDELAAFLRAAADSAHPRHDHQTAGTPAELRNAASADTGPRPRSSRSVFTPSPPPPVTRAAADRDPVGVRPRLPHPAPAARRVRRMLVRPPRRWRPRSPEAPRVAGPGVFPRSQRRSRPSPRRERPP